MCRPPQRQHLEPKKMPARVIDDYTWERMFSAMISRPPRPPPRQEEPPKVEKRPTDPVREWWEPVPADDYDPEYERINAGDDYDYEYFDCDETCFITIDDVSDDDYDIEILDVPDTPGGPDFAELTSPGEGEAGLISSGDVPATASDAGPVSPDEPPAATPAPTPDREAYLAQLQEMKAKLAADYDRLLRLEQALERYAPPETDDKGRGLNEEAEACPNCGHRRRDDPSRDGGNGVPDPMTSWGKPLAPHNDEVFRRKLEEPCPYHGWRVNHKLKECRMFQRHFENLSIQEDWEGGPQHGG